MGLVAKAFQDIITFSRATQTGTYVNSSGYITNSSVLNYLTYSNQPENAAWTKSNSFVQQNLLLYSEDFTNANWVLLNVAAPTANTTIAPDGTLSADTVTASAGAAAHNINQNTSVSLTPTTFSVYIKAGTHNFVQIFHGANSAYYANFNLSTGVLGTVGGSSSATITAAANGFYRCTLTITPSAASGFRIAFISSATAVYNESWTAAGTETVFAWGAQLVQGSVPGDYRATTSAALPCLYADYNGALRARKLCENNAATIAHFMDSSSSTIAAGVFTGFVKIKAGERTSATMYLVDSVGIVSGTVSTFNLTTGVVTTGTQASIVSVGGGYFQCAIYGTCAAGAGAKVRVLLSDGSAYTGDGSSGIYIADAQLNDGSAATSYYDTTAYAYNAPRFDYDPVTLAAKGLLVEESRANLLLNSVLAGTGAAPTSFTQPIATGTSAPATSTRSGISAAYSQSATAQRPFIEQTVTTVAASVYTASMNVEAVSGLTYNDIIGVSGVVASAFRLNGATVLSSDAAAVGKLEAVFTAAGVSSSCRFGIGVSGNATGTLRFSCPQFELGAFATSFIPSVASQVTRAADVASVNTLSPWFNQAAGTFYAEFDVIGVNGSANMLGDGAAGTSIVYLNPTFNLVSYNGVSGPTTSNATAANTIAKASVAYATNSRRAVLNAGTASNQTGDLQAVTKLELGKAFGTVYLNGHLRRVTFYPRQFTAAEQQTLTTL